MGDQPPKQDARVVEDAGANQSSSEAQDNTNGGVNAIPSGAEMLARAPALKAAFSRSDGALDPREIAEALATDLGICPTPLRPNGKAPILPKFNNHATSDPAKVRDVFSDALGAPKDCNVGIVNGTLLPNGRRLFIVDLDTKKSAQAEAAAFNARYKELEAKVGKLPKTVMARTATLGSRGGHLYFSVAPDTSIGPKPGFLPGIDSPIQAVAPSSTIDGRPYKWEPGHAPWDIDIAPAPQALIDAYLAGRAPKASAASIDGGEPEAPAPVLELDRTDMLAKMRAWLRDEAPIAERSRSVTASVVSQCFTRFAASPAEVMDALTEPGGWNDTKAIPSWEIDGDDGDGGGNIERLVWDLWNRRKTAPGASARPDATETFESIAEDAAGAEQSRADTEDLDAIDSFDCVAAERVAEEDPLVYELLDKRAVSALYGLSNVGKSFVGASLGFAVATGTDWAGRKVEKGAVVYIAYEGARRFRRRLAALHIHHECDRAIPLRLIAPPKKSIYDSKAQKAILAAIRKAEKDFDERVLLVIVDTLAAARAGSGKAENNSDDMTEVAEIFRKLAEATGAHVLVIHHTGKDEDRGMRGAYALECAFDTVFKVDGRTIKNPKQRDYEKAADMSVESVLVSIPIKDGEATSRVAIVSAGEPSRVSVDGVAQSPPSAGFERLTKTARLKIEILNAIAGRDLGGGARLTVEDLRTILVSQGHLGVDDKGRLLGAAGKLFQRAKDDLREEGRLSQDGEFVGRLK